MDPVTMALIMGGTSLLGGLGGLSKPSTKSVMPTLINPEQYQVGLDAMSGAYNENNALMQGLLGQSGGYRDQGMGFLQQYLQQTPETYDPMRAQKAFLGSVPQFQQIARDTVGDYSTEDLMRQERDTIMQQVGDQFGGSPMSGAFAGAASQALATPLLQRGQAREQQIGGIASGLMQQSHGLLNQNFFNEAIMRREDQQRPMTAAEYMLGLAGQSTQEAGVHGNLAGQGLAGLAGLTQPVYATPDYYTPRSPFSDFMTGALQGANAGASIATLGQGNGTKSGSNGKV